MRTVLCLSFFLTAFLIAPPASGANVTQVELHQRQEVLLKHERFVGNLRAQAKREGIIQHVPQLYAYFTDLSPAWHLHGYRRGFERKLALTYEHGRRERSMVDIDALLERTLTPEGQPYTVENLPAADIYLLFYRKADCEKCQQVDAALSDWLKETQDLDAVRFDVWIDREPTE